MYPFKMKSTKQVTFEQQEEIDTEQTPFIVNQKWQEGGHTRDTANKGIDTWRRQEVKSLPG
jgi:hypothetical protein